MAKTPSKPAKATRAKARKQPAGGRKVKKAVGVERLAPGEQNTYAANAAAIDTALKRCNAHLKDFKEPAVALVAIKLLKDYYLRHGVKPPPKGIHMF